MIIKNMQTKQSCKIKSTLAFTLAEVLITLAIVGVVAALTLPNLIASYQKKQTVTRLKKAYSVVSQAIQMSEVENGMKDTWTLDNIHAKTFFNIYLKKYIVYTKELSPSELDVVSPRTLLNGQKWSGTTYNPNNSAAHHILLPDGVLMTFNKAGGMWIAIDVNGLQKPNQCGKDTFILFFTPQYGLQPFGGLGTPVNEGDWSYGNYSRTVVTGSRGQSCNRARTGYWCMALIMHDGWEIKDDYPW